ncbi:MAG: ubiquinone biosynthesis regulatory protein kinase UbiB [gamma proteobacterium symbiont of Bathyaustriella thionipta]|nr:ubiquinone biosynthesis regulatory protein kinase UbiB [gamma proteobacterium symbiont of Bathyaustriella thionipta]
MLRPTQVWRMMHISWVLMRHGLDDIILSTHLFRAVHFLRFIVPGFWFKDRHASHAERIRRALEDLGPIFVKFGQVLSTRRDLLPDDLADELVKLQDQVPPFPGAVAQAIIEKAWQEPVADVLQRFDVEPLASASIAQVHAAQMQDGREIVIKVLRPGIEKIIRRDVDLLFIIARLAQRYWKDGRRLRPVEVVEEYEKTIFDELDLSREAANASQLRHNFMGSEQLYVPEIYWDLSRANVMAQERIYGMPVGDVEQLKAKGVSMQLLGERGLEIFFTQVLRDNFFHADMHPGNIFVSDEGQYIGVDFGIMGTLNPQDQRYLAENFLAFFNRDYRRVAELHVESGWVPSATRVDEFESAIRTVSEPIYEKPISEISFGLFLLKLFQTARRFDMEVQPQLVLLQKTFLNIEGLGRQLYPELDLWATAKPFLERWMAQQVGPKAFLRKVKEQLPNWSEQWPEIPGLAYQTLKAAQAGKLKLQWESEQLAELKVSMQRQQRNLLIAVGGGSLLISGILAVGCSSNATIASSWLMNSGTVAAAGGLFLLVLAFVRSYSTTR